MPEFLTPEEQRLALQLVDAHSGGIKFTELLVDLMIATNHEVSPELLEDFLRKQQDIGVLDYAMRLSEDQDRLKMFVYRKLRG